MYVGDVRYTATVFLNILLRVGIMTSCKGKVKILLRMLHIGE